uniref:Uncharacterized protein n=1 Tax=Glossina brevipalpis TaxID=37001 RepID=A0A1A9X0S7_9MUSC
MSTVKLPGDVLQWLIDIRIHHSKRAVKAGKLLRDAIRPKILHFLGSASYMVCHERWRVMRFVPLRIPPEIGEFAIISGILLCHVSELDLLNISVNDNKFGILKCKLVMTTITTITTITMMTMIRFLQHGKAINESEEFLELTILYKFLSSGDGP